MCNFSRTFFSPVAQSGCEVLFFGVGGEEWVRWWCRQGDGCYQIKFAGAVRNNAQTSCATQTCRACGDETACVAERYLTLRIGCERHGRKNPLPFPMSERSHVGNLRQIRKQGKGRSSKRKENRRLSLPFCPRGGRRNVPAVRRRRIPR